MATKSNVAVACKNPVRNRNHVRIYVSQCEHASIIFAQVSHSRYLTFVTLLQFCVVTDKLVKYIAQHTCTGKSLSDERISNQWQEDHTHTQQQQQQKNLWKKATKQIMSFHGQKTSIRDIYYFI